MEMHLTYTHVKYLLALVIGFIIGISYMAVLHSMFLKAKYTLNHRHIVNTKCNINDYRSILRELKKNRYVVYRVVDFIRDYYTGRLPHNKVIVILRHDVDFIPSRAFNMSHEEYALGIRSTYYVRVRGRYNILDPEISKWITWLWKRNFEVGLHYEELYYCNYNFTCARKLFLIDLALLRNLVPVYTVCSHGNKPKQLYINYDIFKRYPRLLNESRLYGEAYLTIGKIVNKLEENNTIKYYKYVSDTTGCDKNWLSILRNAQPGSIIYILIHPDNWNIGS